MAGVLCIFLLFTANDVAFSFVISKGTTGRDAAVANTSKRSNRRVERGNHERMNLVDGDVVAGSEDVPSRSRRAARTEPSFPLVDPSIARILSCNYGSGDGALSAESSDATQDGQQSSSQRFYCHLNASTMMIEITNTENGAVPEALPVKELLPLALECDRVLFAADTCPLAQTQGHQDGQALLASLLRLSEDGVSSRNVVAVLLALCFLESTLHQLVMSRSEAKIGRAPLLKDLLLKMAATEEDQALAPLLRCLLLPSGLNLRNLVWHGFVGKLPRPWVSLVWVLLHQAASKVEPEQQHRAGDSSIPLGQHQLDGVLEPIHPELKRVADLGRAMMKDWRLHDPSAGSSAVPDWLPSSDHLDLWNLSLAWMLDHDVSSSSSACASSAMDTDTPAATIAAIWMVLAEAGLRRDWCLANNREEEDGKARPNVMYVTLDGHGQRNKHNLLLQPYLTDKKCNRVATVEQTLQKNALVNQLGGSCHAIWTDLFVSPSGPNLRATVAHGSWNAYLMDDLVGCFGVEGSMAVNAMMTSRDKQILVDYAGVLLVAMEIAASASPFSTTHNRVGNLRMRSGITPSYRPLFSFSAATAASLGKLKDQLALLKRCTSKAARLLPCDKDVSSLLKPPASIGLLAVPDGMLESYTSRLMAELQGPKSQLLIRGNSRPTAKEEEMQVWTTECVYFEYETNQRLGPLGAARRLLEDIWHAVSEAAETVEGASESLSRLENPANLGNTQRQRNRLLRQIESGSVAYTFYSFAALVAVLCLVQGNGRPEARLEGNVASGRNKDPLHVSEDDLLKATERTRMVVSTVQAFLTANVDRAFKAIQGYTKGKAVQKIMLATVNYNETDLR